MKKLFYVICIHIVIPLHAVDLINDNLLRQTVIISYGKQSDSKYGRYTYELEFNESRPLDDLSFGKDDLLCIQWRGRVYVFSGIQLNWIREQEVRTGLKLPIRIKTGFPADCLSTNQIVYLNWFDENNNLSTQCPDQDLVGSCVFGQVISAKTGNSKGLFRRLI